MYAVFLIYKNLEFSFYARKFALNMSKFLSILKKVFNKYIIVVVMFAIAITTTDEHNVFISLENKRTIKHLEQELAFYRNKSEENKKRLEQL